MSEPLTEPQPESAPLPAPHRVWVPFGRSAKDLPDGLVADVFDGIGPAPDTIGEVEVYVVPYSFKHYRPELIPQMPKLRVVQTLTAGFEHLLPYMREGVTLCNARGVHDASTAELAVTLALSSLRSIPRYVRQAEHGLWEAAYAVDDAAVDDALADKTVLIVGYGAIGQAVERRLAGFEVDVVRVARTAREGVAGFEELPALLPAADVVILIVPATPETRGMVDGEFLARMKDGALLVNVARGTIVDTDALLAETASGRLRAALDVTDPEPLPADHPLWTVPNVLITPHVGGASTAFLPRALRLIHDQLRRYAAGEPLENVITAEY
jgi:phosphoglycerate dehydrogenase-like enzyme